MLKKLNWTINGVVICSNCFIRVMTALLECFNQNIRHSFVYHQFFSDSVLFLHTSSSFTSVILSVYPAKPYIYVALIEVERMVTPNRWRLSNTRSHSLQVVWLFSEALIFAHHRDAIRIICVNDLYDTAYFTKDDANYGIGKLSYLIALRCQLRNVWQR